MQNNGISVESNSVTLVCQVHLQRPKEEHQVGRTLPNPPTPAGDSRRQGSDDFCRKTRGYTGGKGSKLLVQGFVDVHLALDMAHLQKPFIHPPKSSETVPLFSQPNASPQQAPTQQHPPRNIPGSVLLYGAQDANRLGPAGELPIRQVLGLW